MKAAILNPGPSLLQTWDDDFEGLTLAVNRAAIACPCDAWACGDWPAIERDAADVIGTPTLFAAGNSVRELAKRGSSWRGPVVTFESLFGFLHPSESQTGWTLLTGTAAIVYAAWRGAREIDVFGADWSGTRDFDGIEAGGNRSDERWKLEREVFAAVQRVLGERRVEVRRITPS